LLGCKAFVQGQQRLIGCACVGNLGREVVLNRKFLKRVGELPLLSFFPVIFAAQLFRNRARLTVGLDGVLIETHLRANLAQPIISPRALRLDGRVGALFAGELFVERSGLLEQVAPQLLQAVYFKRWTFAYFGEKVIDRLTGPGGVGVGYAPLLSFQAL